MGVGSPQIASIIPLQVLTGRQRLREQSVVLPRCCVIARSITIVPSKFTSLILMATWSLRWLSPRGFVRWLYIKPANEHEQQALKEAELFGRLISPSMVGAPAV
eukprot:scaffold44055_cov17-Prasinocladus_malaysianus.AAC.1